MPEKEPLNQNEAEPVDNEWAESKGDTRNVQIGQGNYIENLGRDYYQNSSSVVQEIFKNVRAGRDITVGDIKVIYNNSENLENIPKPKGFPQNIISSSTDKFVGREKDLESLNQKLKRENEVVIAAVEGMGGVGKTELAIQYSLLNLQLNTYPGGICWLRAREKDIGLQIVNFARTDLGLEPPDDLELPDRVRWCWKRWLEGNTLIVLDDVKKYSDIKPYLPSQPSQFKVLITTRLKLDLPSSLYLEVLSEPDALELLRQLVGSEKVNQELETATELCQRLGYLPLALQLVGRHVKKHKISLTEELRRLEDKGLTDPSLNLPENKRTWTLDIKRGVEAAFELSWEELSEPAQQLGCLLSLFALAPIPWSLVESAALQKSKKITFPGLKLLRRVGLFKQQSPIKQEPKTLKSTRVELEDLHLLQGEDNYQLHQLIQEFLRNKQNNLANADEQKDHFCTAIVEVADTIPETPTLSEINSLTPFIPHLAEAATVYQNWLRDEDLILPFRGLSRFYQGQGAYAQALPWLEQCLSFARERLGEESLYLAPILGDLALFYKDQGRYTEAEPLELQAFDFYKKLLGEEHPDVASSMNNLAALYYSQGRYDSAEPLYVEALEMRKKLLGEEHPYVATSLGSLALLYDAQGRYEEAEPLSLQALEMSKKLLGEEHPDVATSINNLAALYYGQGKYEEAEPLFLQALEMNKKLLGEEHPDVAISIYWLAFLHHKQGQYSEAEPLYIQALAIAEKVLGEDHPNTKVIRGNYEDLKKEKKRLP